MCDRHKEGPPLLQELLSKGLITEVRIRVRQLRVLRTLLMTRRAPPCRGVPNHSTAADLSLNSKLKPNSGPHRIISCLGNGTVLLSVYGLGELFFFFFCKSALSCPRWLPGMSLRRRAASGIRFCWELS